MHVWRSRLSRWFEPLARACPLSPNAITLAALAINIAAAAAFYGGGRQPRLFALGIALLTVGGLADALDGIVARVKNLESRFGDFLDHLADRISDTVVVTGWLLGNGIPNELSVSVIIAVMLNGYAGTQIEATWRERSYDQVGRGEFVLAMVVFPLTSYILLSNGWENAGVGGLRIVEWLATLLLLFACYGLYQRVRLAARMPPGQK